MIFTRIFQTYLEIKDINDIYNPDTIGVCIKMLETRYVGRCYMSCFILKIKNIIQTSLTYLDKNGIICVKFNAEILRYIPGEVIPCCKIIKIESHGKIFAESSNCYIITNQCSALEIYKEHDIIPLIVDSRPGMVRYLTGSNKITISALPFIPHGGENEQPIIHRYTTKKILISSEDKDQIDQLLEQQKKLEQIPNGVLKQPWSFFKTLLYPYKKSGDEIPISDLMKTPNKYANTTISRSHLNDTPTCSIIKPKKNNSAIVMDNSLANIVLIFLNEYNLQMHNIREMAQAYPTLDMVNKYKDTWKIYNAMV